MSVLKIKNHYLLVLVSVDWGRHQIQSRGAADQLYSRIMTEVVAGCNKLEVERKC